MKKTYFSHFCAIIIPLLFLIFINIIAYLEILKGIDIINVDNSVELAIFTFSLIATLYYINKQYVNIRIYINLIKSYFKDRK